MASAAVTAATAVAAAVASQCIQTGISLSSMDFQLMDETRRDCKN